MKLILKIKGMHCASCARIIEMKLMDKVSSAKVDYSEGKAEIEFNPEKITEKEIKHNIIKLGYKVS